MAYHLQLMSRGPSGVPDTARAYLTDHCLNRQDILLKYRIGYVAEPLPGDGRFEGMLSVPYLTPSGSVAALKFRNLGEGGSKYAQHAGQKSRLFNTAAWFAADDAIGLAEGEVDAIVATEHLGLPTLGLPGATNWDARLWKPLFKDYRRVILFGDGDEAGRDMNDKIESEIGWRAMVVTCPPGEDVSSMARQGRLAELREQYEGSTSNHD